MGLALLLPGSLSRLKGRATGLLEVRSGGRFRDSTSTAIQLLVLESNEQVPHRKPIASCWLNAGRFTLSPVAAKGSLNRLLISGVLCSNQTPCRSTGQRCGCSGRKKNLTASDGGRFGEDRCRSSANFAASYGWKFGMYRRMCSVAWATHSVSNMASLSLDGNHSSRHRRYAKSLRRWPANGG